MAVTLCVEPRKVVSWDEFIRDYPRYSIAIDGFCSGPTRSSVGGLRLNINHHESDEAVRRAIEHPDEVGALSHAQEVQSVGRLPLRSTCDQALCLVKLGLFETYQHGGKPTARLWVNDCDQDVVLATYVLMHPWAADVKLFRELERIEDYLDMSAGLFPVKRRWSVVRRLCWITEEYTRVKQDGSLFTMGAKEMGACILRMHERVRETLDTGGQELDPDTEFAVLEDHGFWQVVQEVGAHARLGMAEAGIKAFLSVISRQPGHYRYTLARLSPFIPFPVDRLCEELNRVEGYGPDDPSRWGGSDTVGGSMRGNGSSLPPAEVIKVIEDWLRKNDLPPQRAL